MAGSPRRSRVRPPPFVSAQWRRPLPAPKKLEAYGTLGEVHCVLDASVRVRRGRCLASRMCPHVAAPAAGGSEEGSCACQPPRPAPARSGPGCAGRAAEVPPATACALSASAAIAPAAAATHRACCLELVHNVLGRQVCTCGGLCGATWRARHSPFTLVPCPAHVRAVAPSTPSTPAHLICCSLTAAPSVSQDAMNYKPTRLLGIAPLPPT